MSDICHAQHSTVHTTYEATITYRNHSWDDIITVSQYSRIRQGEDIYTACTAGVVRVKLLTKNS